MTVKQQRWQLQIDMQTCLPSNEISLIGLDYRVKRANHDQVVMH
jgi:hypothetical protein